MKNRRERGFTLVELMVVIVLIGLLAGVVSVKVIPILFTGKKTAALSQMKEISKALELFQMQESHFPAELSELTQAYPDWPEGYMSQIPKDPWGEDYVYVVTAARTGSTYQIFCKGEDRLEGTADDITLEAAPTQ